MLGSTEGLQHPHPTPLLQKQQNAETSRALGTKNLLLCTSAASTWPHPAHNSPIILSGTSGTASLAAQPLPCSFLAAGIVQMQLWMDSCCCCPSSIPTLQKSIPHFSISHGCTALASSGNLIFDFLIYIKKKSAWETRFLQQQKKGLAI